MAFEDDDFNAVNVRTLMESSTTQSEYNANVQRVLNHPGNPKPGEYPSFWYNTIVKTKLVDTLSRQPTWADHLS